MRAPFYFAASLAAVNVVLLYFILPESLPLEQRLKPHADAPMIEVFRHGHGLMFGHRRCDLLLPHHAASPS